MCSNLRIEYHVNFLQSWNYKNLSSDMNLGLGVETSLASSKNLKFLRMPTMKLSSSFWETLINIMKIVMRII